MASQSASRAETVSSTEEGFVTKEAARRVCPACREPVLPAAIERYGKYELFGCAACGLHFWEPREMPDARWYEQMYSGRDQEIFPLEPGHKYFLADTLAPRCGDLLDIGCGTGNFLVAARKAGYRVTGTELDRNAAKFATEKLQLPRVYSLTAAEFAGQLPHATFDVVTLFEVLEHQADPVEFIASIHKLVRDSGLIALSVPNRERWLTGPDVLDYPPNHFLRWNAVSLQKFLRAQGFEVLAVREQPASLVHTAQMLNMVISTGLTRRVGGQVAPGFREVIQMSQEQAAAALQARPSLRQRVLGIAAKAKSLACMPLALAAYPYVRLLGLKDTYLYCIARKLPNQTGSGPAD